MDKVRILWSGITGRTGTEARELVNQRDDVEIVAGVNRTGAPFYTYDELDNITEDFDVIVDFSHADVYDKVLDFAIKCGKPIVIGTSGLSEEQLKRFEDASYTIPIFRGGNFRYEVKKFIDDVVDYARTCPEDKLELVETHYKTKKIPSETAKVVAKKVYDATGKEVIIKSFLEYDDLINDWRVGDFHCRVVGFKELANDVLNIAKMMKDKTPDGVYDLDRILAEENQKKL